MVVTMPVSEIPPVFRNKIQIPIDTQENFLVQISYNLLNPEKPERLPEKMNVTASFDSVDDFIRDLES